MDLKEQLQKTAFADSFLITLPTTYYYYYNVLVPHKQNTDFIHQG